MLRYFKIRGRTQHSMKAHQHIIYLLIGFLFLVIQPSWAGTIFTYNNTTLGTLNNQSNCNTTLTRTFNVMDNFSINDLNVGLNYSHTWRGDVRVRLTSPSGTTVTLIVQDNADSWDHQDFMLDDESFNAINNGNNNNTASPYYGADRIAAPDNPLAAFDGENAYGTWTLEFCNVNQGSSGGRQLAFNRAQLLFDGDPLELCSNGIDDDLDGLIDDADGDCLGISLEAECATIGSNWNTVTDATASNSEYLTIQGGLNSLNSTPTGTADHITFTFDIIDAGYYKVFGRVYAPTDDDNSFWVRANGGTWYRWNDLPNTGWTWAQVHDSDNAGALVFFPLVAGSNTIDIAYREDGTLLDKIFVTLSGAAPVGTGETASNCFVPEICDNGTDDDGDGLIDCADDECTVSSPGSVSGNENYCSTYTPTEITSVSGGTAGANSFLQYDWQQTADTVSGIWTDLGAADTLEILQPPAISQTTYYRRKASTFHCADSLFSNIVSKQVDQNVANAGTIGYEESIAGSYDPAPIVSVSAPSGGSGTIEYSWYSSTNNTWNLIAGANADSYDPPLINVTTWYKREARTVGCIGNVGCCGSTWRSSNIVKKEVIVLLDGGGEINLVAIPSTSQQGNVLVEKTPPKGLMAQRATYQWEYSDDKMNWTELYGAIGPDLPISRFERHTYFRRKVRNAVHLPWEYSNVVLGNAILPWTVSAGAERKEGIIRRTSSANDCFLQTSIQLEGAKNNQPLMRDDLRAKSLLPPFSPYGDQGSFQKERVAGQVFQKEGAKAVVDWVNLELYGSLKDEAPAFAVPALLLRDGSICALDGQSSVTIDGTNRKKYHLLIRHRNHEPVASKKQRFKKGKVVSIQEFYTIDEGRLGQQTLIMTSVIYRVENFKGSGNGMVKGYEFSDFNMDGVSIPAGPGNEFSQILKYSLNVRFGLKPF